MPDCIQFVYEVKEPKGNSMFGTIDRDFAENKMVGSEIFLTPFIGESLVYRTVLFSFLDLTKSFIIDTVAYDYNRNTKCVNITGRTPRKMVMQVARKIEPEYLYEDEVFQRYCRAKAKVRLGELLTSFDFNLPGGIRPNYNTFVTKADAEFAAVLEMMKGENTPDWIYLSHF
jgi:tRNA isopentenyl-2-thiomethyl-A-37 hydroxylase MiaE